MSANISSVPAGSAAASALALSGSGDANPGAGLNGADTNNGLGPFAAIFQKLQGLQAVAQIKPELLALTEENATKADSEGTTVDLNALLPFLEAMGLTKPVGEKPDIAPQEEPNAEAVLATLSPPAITPTAVDPAISAAVKTAKGDNGTNPAIATIDMGAADKPAEAVKTQAELSAGREFSAQLVAAIKDSKEQAHAPGDTADVVHQVITNASPAAGDNPAKVPVNPPVTLPVGSVGWSDEVGNRMVWMANHKDSHAELVLTPPQMGRVEISLSVSGDKAVANFVSSNPAVREALEAAMPRLREVLADAGIQLGQAQVGAENAHQSAQQEKNGDNFGFGRDARLDVDGVLRTGVADQPAPVMLKMGRGLVDVFA